MGREMVEPGGLRRLLAFISAGVKTSAEQPASQDEGGGGTTTKE